MEQQEEYIKQIAIIIYNKILQIYNNINDKEKAIISKLSLQSAKDLADISLNNYGEFGLFDEFTAKQISDNCSVGIMQIYFEEYIGTKIVVTKFSDDIEGLQIQLINRDEDTIAIINDKDSRTICIKNDEGRELRIQTGNLHYFDGNNKHIIYNVKPLSLNEVIKMFREKEIERLSFPNQLADDNQNISRHSK